MNIIIKSEVQLAYLKKVLHDAESCENREHNGDVVETTGSCFHNSMKDYSFSFDNSPLSKEIKNKLLADNEKLFAITTPFLRVLKRVEYRIMKNGHKYDLGIMDFYKGRLPL